MSHASRKGDVGDRDISMLLVQDSGNLDTNLMERHLSLLLATVVTVVAKFACARCLLLVFKVNSILKEEPVMVICLYRAHL